jgi:hypothetical protein
MMAVKFKDLLTDYAPCVLTPDSRPSATWEHLPIPGSPTTWSIGGVGDTLTPANGFIYAAVSPYLRE